LSHELAHWASRLEYCGGDVKKKNCSYKGQHDKRFYKVLKPIHKKLNIKKEHADALEKRAGYSPPDGWYNSMYMPMKEIRTTREILVPYDSSKKLKKRRKSKRKSGRSLLSMIYSAASSWQN
jgi:hypothetical protein